MVIWFNTNMKKNIVTRVILAVSLMIMGAMVVFAIFSKNDLVTLLSNPVLQKHARFLHIFAVTLFFSNSIVGMLWERRSLASGSKEVILHTYSTVTLLDASLSSPLIILSLIGGLSLSFSTGELWEIGWLSVSFILFILSGVIWIVSDIPTQYKVKKLLSQLNSEDQYLPVELVRLLRLRLWISTGGVLPLIAVFILMVYKPDITAVADWFR